jgi:hypothetical protein
MHQLQKLEISFPCTVDVPEEIIREIDALVGKVCELYEAQNPTRIMWPAGHGWKINWSRMDAAFLGRPAEPNAKESGEPDYDDSIYEISVSEREAYEGEREKRQARRQRVANAGNQPTPTPGTAEYDEETELIQEAEEAMRNLPMVSPNAGAQPPATP